MQNLIFLFSLFILINPAYGEEEALNFMDNFNPQSEYAETILDILESEGFIVNESQEPRLQEARFGCKYPLRIQISKRKQRLYLHEGCSGRPPAVWKVSTGRGRYRTPNFKGKPTGRFESKRYSSRRYPGGGCRPYGNMAWAIFYYRGYAIHGTCAERNLGRPASHGCVRIRRSNAYHLQQMVRKVYGPRRTLIHIF